MVVVSLCAIGSAQLRDRTEHQRVGDDQSQTPKKPAKRGPRAIAVVEFLPKGGARLVPIALWLDGRYYDASFYGANPAPMALQPETLYQAMSYGEPTGWFTVTTPEQVNGAWVAEGQWKPQLGTFDTKVAQQAAKQAKKKTPSPISDDSGPPVLRRSPSGGSPESTSASGSSSSQTTSSGSGNTQAQTNDDSDRPTLRNSSPPSSGSSSSTDSSRPTLGPDTSPNDSKAASAPAPPASSPDENDPDRPTLHRGKPAAQTSPSTSATVTNKPTTSNTKTATATTQSPKTSAAPNHPQSGHAYPAISDAGNYEIRSLLYAMTPAEKEERGKPMLALALEEVTKYRSKRQQENTTEKPVAKSTAKAPAKPAAKGAVPAQSLVAGDYDLRAFDLDFSNSPTLVLTAKVVAPPAKAGGIAFDYFVTVVARVDINGEAQKVFASVTDNNHLDAFPRLEIIDAVDADANGRGDLLFREHSDSSVSYALYRVYPYQMVKVFEGGSNM